MTVREFHRAGLRLTNGLEGKRTIHILECIGPTLNEIQIQIKIKIQTQRKFKYKCNASTNDEMFLRVSYVKYIRQASKTL